MRQPNAIHITCNGLDWPVQFMTFPSGEVHVRLGDRPAESVKVVIEAMLYSPQDVMNLLLVTDAARRSAPGAQIELRMPFVPYARQDRVVLEGEPLSIKVMCSLINAQGYSRVVITDPHSDVTPALLDRVEVVSAASHVVDILKTHPELKNCILIAPDAGARKRVQAAADLCRESLGREVVVIQASKKRDPVSGRLSSFGLEGQDAEQALASSAPLLIVDDICDGGGTFVGLANALQPQLQKSGQKLYLYVTHGLFTKGLEPLLAAGYEAVFCAYSRQGLVNGSVKNVL